MFVLADENRSENPYEARDSLEYPLKVLLRPLLVFNNRSEKMADDERVIRYKLDYRSILELFVMLGLTAAFVGSFFWAFKLGIILSFLGIVVNSLLWYYRAKTTYSDLQKLINMKKQIYEQKLEQQGRKELEKSKADLIETLLAELHKIKNQNPIDVKSEAQPLTDYILNGKKEIVTESSIVEIKQESEFI